MSSESMNHQTKEIVCKTSEGGHHCVSGEYTLVWGVQPAKRKGKEGSRGHMGQAEL